MDGQSEVLLWGVYAIGIAIYLGATQALSSESSGWAKLQKAVATMLLIWGTILLVGAGYGEHAIWHPLPKTTSVTYVQDGTKAKPKLSGEMPFEEIADIAAFERAQIKAMDEDKSIVIFFHTDTCPVCKRLRDTTFKDARVQQKLRDDYVAISVNMSDKKDKKIDLLKKKFQVFGPPGFVFFNSDGEELKDDKFYGYNRAAEFYDILDLISE